MSASIPPEAPAPSVVARYDRDSALRFAIQTAAAAAIPRPSLVALARHLGLWDGREIVSPNEAADTLLADLGLYEPVGRLPRGIERYAATPAARAGGAGDGADRARVLAALRASRVALLRVLGRHPQGGLLVEAMRRDRLLRLMDHALARRAAPGSPFFARIVEADAEFVMLTGWVLPADAPLLDAARALPAPEAAMSEEGAFAVNLIRAALERGLVADAAPPPPPPPPA